MSWKAPILFRGGSKKLDEILKQLEEYREHHNISKRQMATIVGVGKSTYYNWLNGEPIKKIIILEKIKQILEEK